MGWAKVIWQEYKRLGILFKDLFYEVASELPSMATKILVMIFVISMSWWVNPLAIFFFYIRARAQFPEALRCVRLVKHENIYLYRKRVHKLVERFPNERRFQILKRAVDAKIKRQGLTNLI